MPPSWLAPSPPRTGTTRLKLWRSTLKRLPLEVSYLAIGPEEFRAATAPLLEVHKAEGMTAGYVDYQAAIDGGPFATQSSPLIFSGLASDQRRRLIEASVAFLSENPRRGSVFVLVGEGLVEELQPTSMIYLSLRGDFRAESQA